jgi:membrane protein required for colicin V production
MQLIDLFLAGLLVFGAYKGYKQGLALVVVNTVALFAALLLAFRFLDFTTQLLSKQIESNQYLLPVLAFALLFILSYMLLSWFGKFTSKAIRHTLLGPIDQGAGAFLGLFRMAFILSSLLFGLQILGISFRPMPENLILLPALAKLGPASFQLVSPLLPFLKKFVQDFNQTCIIGYPFANV